MTERDGNEPIADASTRRMDRAVEGAIAAVTAAWAALVAWIEGLRTPPDRREDDVEGLRGMLVAARRVLLGHRPVVSAVTVGLGLALAPLVAVRTARWMPYPRIERWVGATWTGTDPHAVVFVAAGALIGLAAASAIVNSGFVPTATLVMGPVFGIAVTRYGTPTVDPVVGATTVSLPEAVGFAAGVAIVVGLPLATVGFLLGEGVRRTARLALPGD